MENLSDLKKLIDVCRKAGITEFKGFGVELKLSNTTPVSNYKKRQAKASKPNHGPQGEVPTDEPTEDTLLFWSSGQTENQEPTA